MSTRLSTIELDAAIGKLNALRTVCTELSDAAQSAVNILTEGKKTELELKWARERITCLEGELRLLDEQEKKQSRRLDYALKQMHRRCPCETCAHGDGKGGCLIGGCTYTRADNLDLWEWNGW